MKKAVEVGEALLKAKVVPMTKDETEIFIILTVYDRGGQPLPEEAKSFGHRVLEKRLEVHQVPATDIAIALLAAISKTPGDCVLYAAVIKALHSKLNRKVTFDDIVNYFPWGFPTIEARHEIWDGQKVVGEREGSDNWLDHAEAWN